MNAKYRVEIWDSERGWGQSHVCDNDFDTLEEATAYYNAEYVKNSLARAPDYYMFPKEPRLVDVDREPKR